MSKKRTLCKVQNTYTQNIKEKRSTYMWKKAHPNTELRVQSVRIMHVETSWQTLERDLPVMVHVLQGMRPTAKVFMMTGTQKLRHEWSNMQDINYEELRPLQCNWMRSKERDCSLLGLRLPKSCSAWEGEVTTFRGRDAKTMPKEPSSNSAGNTCQSTGSVSYWLEGPPEDWWQLRRETCCATKYMHLCPIAYFVCSFTTPLWLTDWLIDHIILQQ